MGSSGSTLSKNPRHIAASARANKEATPGQGKDAMDNANNTNENDDDMSTFTESEDDWQQLFSDDTDIPLPPFVFGGNDRGTNGSESDLDADDDDDYLDGEQGRRRRTRDGESRLTADSTKSTPPTMTTTTTTTLSSDSEKWWNEQPLPGSPYRPATLLTNLLSKSPKTLLGWDYEKFEQDISDVIVARGGDPEVELYGPDSSKRITFGFVDLIADAVLDNLLKRHDEKHTAAATDNNESVGEVKERGDNGDYSDGSVANAQRQENGAQALMSNNNANSSNKAKTNTNSGNNDGITNLSMVRTADIASSGGTTAATTSDNGDNIFREMRETDLYKFALTSLRWQRDAYLAGPDHADLRRKQRIRQEQTANMEDLPKLYHDLLERYGTRRYMIPQYDPTALGNKQIIDLANWFIPSPIVQDALRPIVLWLPRPGDGPLHRPIVTSITDLLIPMSQGLVDDVVKNSVLWFLKDEGWRRYIKESTGGYIRNRYREKRSYGDGNKKKREKEKRRMGVEED